MLSLNKRAAAPFRGSIGALALGLSAIVAPEARATLDFLIEESGDAANPSFTLKVTPSVFGLGALESSELESPRGERFNTNDPLWNGSDERWEFEFPNFQSSLDFLDGQWAYHVDSPFSDPATLDFRFEDLDESTVDHSAPLYVSPNHDMAVKSGDPYIVEWDYGWRDGAETRTILTERFEHVVSRLPFGLPAQPGAFNFRRTVHFGEERSSLLRMERGVLSDGEVHRIEHIYSADESLLPFDVEYTLTVETSLNDHVWVRNTDASLFQIRYPRVSLSHTRVGGQFTVTISSVPEPSALLLLSAAVVASGMSSRRGC